MSDQSTVGGVDLNGRVFYLEKGFNQLSSEVKNGFAEIGSKFNTMVDKMSAASSTDWKTIIAFASLAVALVGGFITVTKTPIEERLTRVEQISADFGAAAKTFMTREDYRYERDRSFTMLMERNHEEEQSARQDREEARRRDEVLADKIEHVAVEQAKSAPREVR